LSNGEPYFTRDISIGGFDITKSIAQELKMDLEEAEKYKREREVNIPSVTSILDELVMEIQRSFDYFKSAYLNVEINRIVLSGGGAKYKNLDRILSQKLHIPITFANPFRKIQFDSVKFPPDYLQEISLLASVCTGLALRRLI
jgi:type IV pilus assembly protein PilM